MDQAYAVITLCAVVRVFSGPTRIQAIWFWCESRTFSPAGPTHSGTRVDSSLCSPSNGAVVIPVADGLSYLAEKVHPSWPIPSAHSSQYGRTRFQSQAVVIFGMSPQSRPPPALAVIKPSTVDRFRVLVLSTEAALPGGSRSAFFGEGQKSSRALIYLSTSNEDGQSFLVAIAILALHNRSWSPERGTGFHTNDPKHPRFRHHGTG